MASEPKTLLFDIETSLRIGYYFDDKEPYCIVQEIQPSYMLSFAWKWLHEEKIRCLALPDFKGYKPGVPDDEKLVGKLHELLSQADFVMGHNSDSFDLKYTNARLIFHGFEPPKPYQTIDTLKAARRILKTGSNRLDALSRYFGFGAKLPHTGKDTWVGCMTGDKKAWKIMKEYNPHDVFLLEKLYYKLRPYMPNHPNINFITRKEAACKVCGCTRLQKGGHKYYKSGWRQRFQCMECFSYTMGPMEKHPNEIFT